MATYQSVALEGEKPKPKGEREAACEQGLCNGA